MPLIQIELDDLKVLMEYIHTQSVYMTDDHSVEMEEECHELEAEYERVTTALIAQHDLT